MLKKKGDRLIRLITRKTKTMVKFIYKAAGQSPLYNRRTPLKVMADPVSLGGFYFKRIKSNGRKNESDHVTNKIRLG